MNWIAALIGGLGIGSLLTTFLNHFLAQRSNSTARLYQEKREAYIGMVRALYDAEVEPSPKTQKAFGYYLNIAKIFGSKDVVSSGYKIITSQPNSDKRDHALEEFHEAMKRDLERI